MIRKPRKNKQSLGISTVSKVAVLFQSKNWEIDDEEGQPINSSTFKRYCEMITPFNSFQREFILELSQRFIAIDMNQYQKHLIMCLDKLDAQILTEHIIVCPLRSETDINKIKSSDLVAYPFKGGKLKNHSKLIDKEISVCHYEELPTNYTLGTTLILVDDFIGTGDTVESAVSYLVSKYGVELKDITVLALVTQQQGAARLSLSNIRLVSSIITNRGISDNYGEDIVAEKLKQMEEIESKLNITKDLSLGYKQSEALVTMERTPNNTFPVFWFESPSSSHIAAFPRF